MKFTFLLVLSFLIQNNLFSQGNNLKKQKNHLATIHFINGQKLKKVLLIETGDTSLTVFIKNEEGAGGLFLSLPIGRIEKIRLQTGRRNHLKGAIVGAAIGLVPAAVVAGQVGKTGNCPLVTVPFLFNLTTEQPDPVCADKHRRNASLVGFGGVAFGAILGGILGTARHENIEINGNQATWNLEKLRIEPFLKKGILR